MKSAIGLIELSSIARGLRTVDMMIKKAPIEVLISKTVSPGKFIILVTGDVASVDESMREGNQTADSYLVDHLFIPQIHPQVMPGIQSKFSKVKTDALTVIETHSVAAAILSLDSALKAADVHLLDLKLGQGLGGKGYYVLTGTLSEVEAATDAAKLGLQDQSKLLQSEIIPRPHTEMRVR